jgi:hypothetical protein
MYRTEAYSSSKSIPSLWSRYAVILSDLVVAPGNSDALCERCEAALLKANLKPDGIKANFLVPFAIAAKAA